MNYIIIDDLVIIYIYIYRAVLRGESGFIFIARKFLDIFI